MPQHRSVDRLRDLAEDYQGFILDQWGVIHDGTNVLPGALEVLAELHQRRKRVVLLSNSGRRAAQNRQRLAAMGVDVTQLAGIVTSGEAAWQVLRDRAEPPWSALGRRCFLMTLGTDTGPVDGLDVELVQRVEDADFVYLTGLNGQPAGAWGWVAETAARHGVPIVCANPDRTVVTEVGIVDAPGALAAMAEALGGVVHYVGKPYSPIYEACLHALDGIDKRALLAIGDSLEHDIAGARNIGIHACFITHGIHTRDLIDSSSTGAAAAPFERLDWLFSRYGVTPDFVLPRLVW